mmetsp:Transcript_17029/g.23413  ORF Transcript_17029/g.23413 Transcript_17029/m.23413 type:complete len:743 (+) Transcript_17029:535-2763(+)
MLTMEKIKTLQTYVTLQNSKLVSVQGHVIRVSPCRPLVVRAVFHCGKCKCERWTHFEDGIYCAPAVCHTAKCGNKYLEFLRSSAQVEDYQRIRLQELDSTVMSHDGENTGARIPRTFEVEARGSLVNLCIPGDVLTVVGTVQTIQMDVFKARRRGEGFGSSGGGRGGWGGRAGAVDKESGLHQLYLLANSLVCCKASGDRAWRSGAAERRVVAATGAGEGSKSSDEEVLLVGESTAGPLLFTRSSLSSSTSSSSSVNHSQSYSPSELQRIRSLALTDSLCLPLLLRHFCSAIFGHELVKMGLLLALFGGTNMTSGSGGDGLKIRPDIHVLVVGDPGLGKSQMLRAAANMAPRSVYVCGNTSTTAGLTVSVSREASSSGTGSSGGGGGNVTLEAGALVLADQGVCCIDELDKMSSDQHGLLEAMEQQRVSVAKSGVATSLTSRTTVLAAANPAGGHYNRSKSVCENLKMNAALLSRFDLIFILLDRPDEQRDQLIGEHILHHSSSSSFQSSQGLSSKRKTSEVDDTKSNDDEPLAQRLRRHVRGLSHHDSDDLSEGILRRYIEYARQFVHPQLTRAAAKVLQRQYLSMRSQSYSANTSALSTLTPFSRRSGSIPVTTRNLESLIRLAQARARMELREQVTESDALEVVQLLQESLLDAYTDELGRIDTGRKGGISLAKQVKCLVVALNREAGLRGSTMFTKREIQQLMMKLRVSAEIDAMLDVMRTECYLLLKGPQLYQLQTA